MASMQSPNNTTRECVSEDGKPEKHQILYESIMNLTKIEKELASLYDHIVDRSIEPSIEPPIDLEPTMSLSCVLSELPEHINDAIIRMYKQIDVIRAVLF